MFMFLDVFPSLPVRFVSRQEFFWRFGDEPFSRSFFLDGGASSNSFNYTVNITWTAAWLN